ncbi:paired immunoglobulin-like type 2 receptor alpha isoform X1 [Heterocephalus glaber]|uniref:paired immunoglobulin-like type 2 receptor alpha isoform X1 n=1 Tax=Heterocephalus glaber TaxID=10181 RepID=UPI000A33F8DD|nr:paired immunoglobulin-like type 2 receptor alpha isoform X1 [Heterocephalus glaber]
MALLVSHLGGEQAIVWVLLLLSLPSVPLQVGNSAGCSKGSLYEVYQPQKLSASIGGSIEIPFHFCYSWKLAKDPQVRLFWRRNHFHGEFFYNTSPLYIHEDFMNRLTLNWKQNQTSGSLRIQNLRAEDQSVYFFRVQLNTQSKSTEMWQSIKGTILTISPAAKNTTQSPTSVASKATTAGLNFTERKSSEHQSLSLGATVGVAVAAAIALITMTVGLMVFFGWQRKKANTLLVLLTQCRELAQSSEENYENTGNKGKHKDAQQNPKNDIVYASLTLSNLTSPGAPPCHPSHESPQEETLYTVLKTQ